MDHLLLDFVGHARGKALEVDGFPVFVFGFEEQLVAGFVRESDHLGFKSRAIPRARSLNRSVENRALGDVVLHDVDRFLPRVNQITRQLTFKRDELFRREGKGETW